MRLSHLFNKRLFYTPLTEITEERDLGITVTNNMKSSQQCLQAYNKANKVLGVINRSIVYKKKDVLVKLYKSLVRPHLEYCTAAWSPHYGKDKGLLERIQHRFTRMVPGLKHLPYEQRLIQLRLWTLEERRVRADLIEVYKMVNGMSGIRFDSFFEYDPNGRTRGHSKKLRKKRFNTDLRKHFFTDRIINIWNALDDRTVTSATLNSFKNGLERLRNSRRMGLLWSSVAKDP